MHNHSRADLQLEQKSLRPGEGVSNALFMGGVTIHNHSRASDSSWSRSLCRLEKGDCVLFTPPMGGVSNIQSLRADLQPGAEAF